MSAQPQGLSLGKFIAWEAAEEEKHEYVAGQISAFTGGTLRHAAIACDVLTLLNTALKGRPGKALGSDALIVTPQSGRYADVTVTYDERDLADLGQRSVRYPILIVEVLSESTVDVDRGDKLDEYRLISSLQEYVLIDSRRRWVEAYRRNGDIWFMSLPMIEGVFQFASVDAAISLDDLYTSVGI